MTKHGRRDMAEMAAFHSEHPFCWMCMFLRAQHASRAELHHIAGRGRRHCKPENFAALCRKHHQVIQSRKDAELMCLVLKRKYDRHCYDPAFVCNLRGRADTWITDADVDRSERVMNLMCEMA